MNRIIIILISIGSLAATASHAQTITLRQYKKKALNALAQKDYYTAIANYQTVLQVEPEVLEHHYNYAEASRNFHAYTLAEQSYEQVAQSEEKSNYPMTDFWLADVKKSLGKYDEAKSLFQQYLETTSVSDTSTVMYRQRAQDELDYLTWASAVVLDPDEDVTIHHLDERVNTPFSETSPIEIDSSLYYASLRFENKKDRNMPSRPISKVLESENREEGQLLEENFNVNDRHTANATFNHDGSRLYYTICTYGIKNVLPCEIYYRDKTDEDSWSAPIKLPATINMLGYTATQPNLSYDEETGKEVLFFVSDRPGGKGGTDLWCSAVQDTIFSKAYNIAPLNTPYDEITPFYHDDANMLYFSSNGRQSLGGFDIYKVAKEGDQWKEIEHLGYPLNSSYNDLYYSVNQEGTKAYFSSNRLGSFYLEKAREACCNDIYSVDISPIQINLIALTFDDNTKLPLFGTEVELIALKEVLETDSHLDNNKYAFDAKRDMDYMLIAKKVGYQADTTYLSTQDIKNSTTLTGELYLKPYPLDLIALTFDAETEEPLLEAKVKLLDCDGKEIDFKSEKYQNDFAFSQVINDNCYKLIVTRDGYFPDSIQFDTPELLLEPTTLTKRIKLRPMPLESLLKYLPLRLYFDNDQPDSRTTRTYTKKAYDETITNYVLRRPEFKRVYSKSTRGEIKFKKEAEIDMLFDDYILAGSNRLDIFASHLIVYLREGNNAQIMIKGFASPLAGTRYNNNLTKRRISSIRNFFKKYQGGIMVQYIETGQLQVTEVPHGEYLADKSISDSVDDRKNSIFSPKASLERRVEIVEIRVEE